MPLNCSQADCGYVTERVAVNLADMLELLRLHTAACHPSSNPTGTPGLKSQQFFDPKFVWTKIVLNQNFVWKMYKKKTHLNLLKKTFEVILNEKICCTEHEGDKIRCSQSCLSYYQPVFAEHVTKIGFGFLGWSFT